jgi:hypothetical protein
MSDAMTRRGLLFDVRMISSANAGQIMADEIGDLVADYLVAATNLEIFLEQRDRLKRRMELYTQHGQGIPDYWLTDLSQYDELIGIHQSRVDARLADLAAKGVPAIAVPVT